MEAILDGIQMSENINDTERETEYVSLEDPLNMYRTVSNETTLICERSAPLAIINNLCYVQN